MKFAQLRTRIVGTPLAIDQRKLEVILQAIGPRVGVITAEQAEQIMIEAGQWSDPSERKSYRITEDGIACIPIRGTLMKKASGLLALSGCSTYEAIGKQLKECMADAEVKGILLDVDSPGGETHGMFELTDLIYSLRGEKPIYASINDHALSAAYCLASAADRLFITQTGAAGSIGVFALHVDQSGADEKAGVSFTYVHAGKKKVDGNPHEPLSKTAESDIQAEVDREYQLFVDAVSRNRGIDPKAVQETEAGLYFAESAVAKKLADEVGTCEDALNAIVEEATGVPRQTGLKGEAMPAIPPHKTATVTGAWDGPANKKRLRDGEKPGYYNRAYAFRDDSMDTSTKSAYSFIHHEVSFAGDIGAANVKACQSGIGILNGGRGGGGRRAYSSTERRGIYNHLAKHLRDAGEEPSPLKSYKEYRDSFAAIAAQAQLDELEISLKGDDMAKNNQPAITVQGKADDAEDYMKKAQEAEAEADAAEKKADEAEEAEAEDAKDLREKATAARKKADEARKKADDAKKSKKSKKGKKAGSVTVTVQANDGDDDEDEDEDEEEDDRRRKDDDDDDAKKAEQVTSIVNLCALAGHPELAATYINAGHSVKKVQTLLLEKRAAAVNDPGRHVDPNFGVPTASTSALERMEREAITIARNSGGKLSKADAYAQLLSANPALYDQYLDERPDSMASAKVKRAYIQALSPRLSSMGLGSQTGSIQISPELAQFTR